MSFEKSEDSPPDPKFQKQNNKKKNHCQSDYNALIKLKTRGSRFILSKLHPYYYISNNTLLFEYVSELDLIDFFRDINSTVKKHWPPQKLITISYMLIPFSCGLSLLSPYCGFQNAEKIVDWKIDEYNIKWEKKGIKVGWVDEELVFKLYSRRNKEEHDDFADIDVIIA